MLEKFLNKKVAITFTCYCTIWKRQGTVTKIDEKFIEIDNNEIISIEYIVSVIEK